ncbi:MAG: hypothetical protein Q4D99_08330, partial [Bacillota bacterium]|nr:hypothetical protein [Bacillota bacterium]
MMKNKVKKAVGILLAFSLAFSTLIASPPESAFAAVDPSTLAPLDRYAGVKYFDFSVEPQRENVPESIMVDPEYSIRLSKLTPDEYFGANVSQLRDSVSGQNVDGIILGIDGVKGSCGCIYRKMFQYRDMWIDVKTTYMDWSVYSPRSSFMAGGFAQHRWRSTWWVEMKHEFFISGTSTPINIKGFMEYDDVDNSQGLYLDMDEVDDLWVNSGGTIIGYKNVPGNVQYVQNSRASYVVDRDMLCIQSMTDNDIAMAGGGGYSADEAAGACFAFTFSGSVIHTCMVDDESHGFNVMNVSDRKDIPSDIPEEGSNLVGKTVSDEDETNVESISLRNWEGWTYRINVSVPIETEVGNFYEGLTIEDQIDSDLTVNDVRIERGAGEDATELFEISEEDNVVRASALDTRDEEFYGYEYFMYIDVSLDRTKDEMIQENRLNENYASIFVNGATVKYTDDNGETNVDTNETETSAQYELEADVVISKEIRAADNYPRHGKPVFIFKLQGISLSGEEIELNGCVSIRAGETQGSVTFRNVPEGEYRCSEYETLRFEAESISNVSGGRVSGDEVLFTIDSTETRRA